MKIFLLFIFQYAYVKVGLDITMSVSQIRTDCFIEINNFTYIMIRLLKFDSQLQCTIQLNHRKTWTKHIRLKQTLHDMHHNETNVKGHSDSGG